MMNGCVPVYWGADDIGSKVPEDCFVDRRKFRDTAEVHAYLRSMSVGEYAFRQQAIREFLSGPAAHRFSSAHFAQVIANATVADLAKGGFASAARVC